MISYFVRRLILLIPTFLGISILVFAITRIVPGGPIERMIAQMKHSNQQQGGGGVTSQVEQGSPLTEEQLQQLKEYYGFDKPILVSYIHWLGNLFRLDLGVSTRYHDPVWDMIVERLPISTFYGVTTLILTYIICIPLGILKTLQHRTIVDWVTSVTVFIGYAVPGFVVGITLLVLFAVNLDWFPVGGFQSEGSEELSFIMRAVDIIHHAALPLVSYVAGSFAVMTLLMKNSLMDNVSSDYVRTAIAKGVPYKRAIFKHALRNSLIPMATHFGNNISVILMGSFLIEKIFDIDGMGLLGFESVVERDYPVVLGVLVLSSLLMLVGNILSDICVALVDPRIQFK